MLSPLNLSTYYTLGYVQTLTRDITNTVESFLKALAIIMVTSVIEQLNCVAPISVEDDTMSMNQTMGETRSLVASIGKKSQIWRTNRNFA